MSPSRRTRALKGHWRRSGSSRPGASHSAAQSCRRVACAPSSMSSKSRDAAGPKAATRGGGDARVHGYCWVELPSRHVHVGSAGAQPHVREHRRMDVPGGQQEFAGQAVLAQGQIQEHTRVRARAGHEPGWTGRREPRPRPAKWSAADPSGHSVPAGRWAAPCPRPRRWGRAPAACRPAVPSMSAPGSGHQGCRPAAQPARSAPQVEATVRASVPHVRVVRPPRCSQWSGAFPTQGSMAPSESPQAQRVGAGPSNTIPESLSIGTNPW